jgi:hypothetical protein
MNEEEEVEEKAAISREVWIPVDSITLPGELSVPGRAEGLVLFAHGSGNSRHSPRNQYVAQVIREAGVGTLLLDLLTREEERIGFCCKIHWPHKILWQILLHSHYRMWSKYFLQQSLSNS